MAADAIPTGPIVVGIDGSEASLIALRHAAQEAHWRGVELHALHALDVTPAVLHLADNRSINTRELAESDREEIWERAAAVLDDSDVEAVRVNRDGDAGSVLVDYSREIGASAVVVGPRGRGRMVDALLGSTAQDVIGEAECDVLVVKSQW